jgi:hypothetical protein
MLRASGPQSMAEVGRDGDELRSAAREVVRPPLRGAGGTARERHAWYPMHP